MKDIICFLFLLAFFLSTTLYSSEIPPILENFWIIGLDEGCSNLNMYHNEAENNTKIVINCNGEETILDLNFPVVLGYANPEPAQGSTFVLENKNLNYITNPEQNLKVHMTYLANEYLNVEIKTENFKWRENFKINFLNEFACPAETECLDNVVGNDKTSELILFLKNNPQYASYLQELVNKIVENKEKSPEMAKIAAIFIKNWLHSIVNIRAFSKFGLIQVMLVGGHCGTDECCIVKSRRDGTVTYCWTKCHYLYIDP